VRPAVVAGELVLRKPVLPHPRLHVLGHAGVVRDEVQPALLVSLVLRQDFAAPLVRGLRVVVAEPDVVGAERPVVVRVGLAVGDRVELVERLAPAGVEDPQQQLVLRRVVSRRPWKRDAVLGMVGQRHPVAVGLHPVVARAEHPWRVRADARQHATPGIAGHAVGADRDLQHPEMVAVVQHARLHAGPRLAVGRLRFAADVVVRARCGHQVAFIRGIDEHPCGIRPAAQHPDRRDPRALLPHAVLAIEPLVPVYGYLVLGHESLEDPLRHVGFENPHRARGAVDGRRALPLVAVRVARLPAPRRRLLVVPPDAVVELPREAADHGLVPRVGEAQAAAGEAAQVRVGADDHDGLAHACRLDRRHDAGRRRAVDDDVVLGRGLQAWRRRNGEDEDRQRGDQARRDTRRDRPAFTSRLVTVRCGTHTLRLAHAHHLPDARCRPFRTEPPHTGHPTPARRAPAAG
jgi:hypothetical protein